MSSSRIAVLLTTLLVGCAHAESAEPELPRPSLAAAIDAPNVAVVTTAADATHAIDDGPASPPAHLGRPATIRIDGLKAASTFAPAATTYIVWTRATSDDAWSNAANVDATVGDQEARFVYPHEQLFVRITAERVADARTPSGPTLAEAQVSRASACATHVRRSDVLLSVRMCGAE